MQYGKVSDKDQGDIINLEINGKRTQVCFYKEGDYENRITVPIDEEISEDKASIAILLPHPIDSVEVL